jgi:hypothetical protein
MSLWIISHTSKICTRHFLHTWFGLEVESCRSCFFSCLDRLASWKQEGNSTVQRESLSVEEEVITVSCFAIVRHETCLQHTYNVYVICSYTEPELYIVPSSSRSLHTCNYASDVMTGTSGKATV